MISYYPIHFDVPNTPTALRLRLARPLDWMQTSIMLAVMADHISAQMQRHYANPLLPGGKFDWDVGEDLAFSVMSLISSPVSHQMTWGVLSDVVEGLRLFLVEGRRSRESYFRVEKVVGGKYVSAGHGMLVRRKQDDRIATISRS